MFFGRPAAIRHGTLFAAFGKIYAMPHTIYTIGHSTHSEDEFVAMLTAHHINHLVDIRTFPGSKRFPHFNKQSLEVLLPQHQIQYTHLKDLGGRRNPKPDSRNTGWRLSGFRGYADYMETQSFMDAAHELEHMAEKENTAFMCSEAVWWSCHRSLLSDWLKFRGWTVLHIMGKTKLQEHPYTAPAKIIDGKLSYESDQLSIL